ncbi:MAG TPA: hypothetical protein DCQ37_14215 [Desulfobacteraceae bacterium]|nr:hypothetical protein [Desulfobacteraceae bacterium]
MKANSYESVFEKFRHIYSGMQHNFPNCAAFSRTKILYGAYFFDLLTFGKFHINMNIRKTA